MNPRPLTVLQSFKALGLAPNPYTAQLNAALVAHPGATSETFSWKRALQHHDVVHLHWPEALIERRRRLTTAGRQLVYLALLLRWRLGATAVVRTVHNLELPSGLPAHQRWLLRLTERWTDAEVHLNHATRTTPGTSARVVPHGHYEDWYDARQLPEPVHGRVLFIGRIRRYKRVDLLLDAFRGLTSEHVSLRVVGQPSSPELVRQLLEHAQGDPRTVFELSYVDDDAFVREVGEAQLVVLPYPEMHNSGSVLAALSLGRPVLVPGNEVNRALADEVGPGWVRLYDELTPAALEGALGPVPAGAPDLSARDWARTAQAHVEVYSAAVETAQRRRSVLRRRPAPR